MIGAGGTVCGRASCRDGGEFFLVGNTKEPCDFEAAGFESPGEIDALERRSIRLTPRRAVELGEPLLDARSWRAKRSPRCSRSGC